MPSVWDDPEEVDQEEVTPLPETQESGEAPFTLNPEKLEALTVQVVEKVVREVLPELAEKIIRERLEKLLQEGEE